MGPGGPGRSLRCELERWRARLGAMRPAGQRPSGLLAAYRRWEGCHAMRVEMAGSAGFRISCVLAMGYTVCYTSVALFLYLHQWFRMILDSIHSSKLP